MCKCYPRLVSLVEKSPNTFCDVMISKGYISPEQRNFIRMDTVLPSDKARKLVDAMTDRVQLDPTSYSDFIEILGSEGQIVLKELHACSLVPQKAPPPTSLSQEEKLSSGELPTY